jgi:uncharacterized protein with PIN domain
MNTQETHELPRCHKCNGTNFDVYKTVTKEFSQPTRIGGKPVDRVVRRWTKCKQCGQQKVWLSHEHGPAKRKRGRPRKKQIP